MGISDDAYAKELEKLRAEAAVVYTQQMTLQATGITTGASVQAKKTPTMTNKDLDHEACKVSISTLVDMWVLRWQDRWVTENEIRDADDFWRIAFVRLENVNKIEKHTLGDSYDKVYRIIE
jgi:hypothetical protein